MRERKTLILDAYEVTHVDLCIGVYATRRRDKAHHFLPEVDPFKVNVGDLIWVDTKTGEMALIFVRKEK